MQMGSAMAAEQRCERQVVLCGSRRDSKAQQRSVCRRVRVAHQRREAAPREEVHAARAAREGCRIHHVREPELGSAVRHARARHASVSMAVCLFAW